MRVAVVLALIFVSGCSVTHKKDGEMRSEYLQPECKELLVILDEEAAEYAFAPVYTQTVLNKTKQLENQTKVGMSLTADTFEDSGVFWGVMLSPVMLALDATYLITAPVAGEDIVRETAAREVGERVEENVFIGPRPEDTITGFFTVKGNSTGETIYTNYFESVPIQRVLRISAVGHQKLYLDYDFTLKTKGGSCSYEGAREVSLDAGIMR